MGRGRKCLLEQSQKKPKKPVATRKRGEWQLWPFSPGKQEKNNSMLLTHDFLEAVKRMEPKEVVDILFEK